jgi:hypothetical protein
MQQQASNRIGRASTIVEKFGAILVVPLVARVDHILLEGVKQIFQQAERERPGLVLLGQGFKHLRPASAPGQWVAVDAVQILTVLGQRPQTLFSISSAVRAKPYSARIGARNPGGHSQEATGKFS